MRHLYDLKPVAYTLTEEFTQEGLPGSERTRKYWERTLVVSTYEQIDPNEKITFRGDTYIMDSFSQFAERGHTNTRYEVGFRAREPKLTEEDLNFAS